MDHEKKLEARRQRYAERYAEGNKTYYERNRDAVRQKQREAYQRNKAQLKKYYEKMGMSYPPTPAQVEELKRKKTTNISKAMAKSWSNFNQVKKMNKKGEAHRRDLGKIEIPDLSVLPPNVIPLYPKTVKPLVQEEGPFRPLWD